MNAKTEHQYIVLTGATGFIGSTVLKQLISQKKSPIVLLRSNSKLERLQPIVQYQHFFYQQLTDSSLKEQLLALRPSAFIHFAWRGVAGSDRNEPFQILENLPMALASVQLAKSIGCTRWLGIGSQAEYGNPNQRVSETHPTYPTTLYGKAKLATALATMTQCEALELNGAWVRIFSTYGPEDDPNWLIPYLIREFLEGHSPELTRCEQLWDYLYVQDAANAIVQLMNTSANGIFNLGSGKATSLKSIVEILRHHINSKIEPKYGAIPYRSDQVMHLEADIQKLRNATNWSPATSLDQGLKETCEWFKHKLHVDTKNPLNQ